MNEDVPGEQAKRLEQLAEETRVARGQMRELRERLFQAREIVSRLRAELSSEPAPAQAPPAHAGR